MPSWINLPNALTALRLALVPFVLEALAGGRYVLALALFGVAAVSDAADGAIARRCGATTRVGAYLDPIADKCLLSGIFLALAWRGAAPWWLVGAIFGRDLYILLGAAVALRWTRMRQFPPSAWGKFSTFVQIVTAVSLMARGAFGGPLCGWFAGAMPWPCAAITAFSGVHYTWRTLRSRGWIDATPTRE
ncbi:MAG TPA: CDP-alcohol phosphatidyltransferase family protein [Bryobacteraceae bacterium]|nr:CDP-alcohol phosphatidyltransferase family protein [Bryobacteraceae bacterium]